MTHVPTWRKLTVEPLTEHALLVVVPSAEKVTGTPEAPPVAWRVWLVPTAAGDVGGVNDAIVCAAGAVQVRTIEPLPETFPTVPETLVTVPAA
jgi:hypothetical protein